MKNNFIVFIIIDISDYSISTRRNTISPCLVSVTNYMSVTKKLDDQIDLSTLAKHVSQIVKQ